VYKLQHAGKGTERVLLARVRRHRVRIVFAVQALNLAAFHSEVDESSVDGMMHTLVWGKLKAKKVLAFT